MSRKCRSEMCSGSRVMKLNIQLPIPFTRRDGGRMKNNHAHALYRKSIKFYESCIFCWVWSLHMAMKYKVNGMKFCLHIEKTFKKFNIFSNSLKHATWKIDSLPMFAIGSREGKWIARPFWWRRDGCKPFSSPLKSIAQSNRSSRKSGTALIDRNEAVYAQRLRQNER